VELPAPVQIGRHRLDVADDLAGYTGLDREQVISLLRREHDSFRAEWHAFPRSLRSEKWFYLSSRMYLFANAIHRLDSDDFLRPLVESCPPPARVLDFGGGSGNLSVALAARGYLVDFMEVSALQKDFVRFRIQKHGLGGRLNVLDWWDELPASRYAAICALDVFEHLPDLRDVLTNQLLPALRDKGVLAESSPFSRGGLENPMHHEDRGGFEALLQENGLRLLSSRSHYRIWQRSAQGQ
jgi:SAM-dependent methyltransferase